MTSGWPVGANGPDGAGRVRVEVLEGTTIQPTPQVAGAEPDPSRPMRAIIRGVHGAVRFDNALLSKHVLFLGGIGTGKTNAMMQLLGALRDHTDQHDVFVIFDSKRDFLQEFYRPGDAVISNEPDPFDGAVTWNIFADVGAGDPRVIGDDIHEIASTVFAEQLSAAGDNLFFAAGARDVFAGVFEALYRDGSTRDNSTLRTTLERPSKSLWEMMSEHDDLAGSARYLTGTGNTPEAVRAFLQQTVNSAFSGVFRQAGDFSVRRFVRERGSRALFVEYDIASGTRLTPVYRVLIDLAIKEALTNGRERQPGNVYFVMDEFSLVPQLQHLTDGVNFGRSLGLKFIAGTQNVEQVLAAYTPEIGRTILSGFGTVFAFRLMDETSRVLVRQRFGANRKHLITEAAVRAQGVLQESVLGNVIEDWVMSALQVGECVASLPSGPPFFFTFAEYPQRG
jgi:Type IV secretion-system coupling protein DNA-binding domain